MKFRLFGASIIIYLTKLLKNHDIKNMVRKLTQLLASVNNAIANRVIIQFFVAKLKLYFISD